MPGLLADVNAEGHLRALLTICEGPAWRETWLALNVDIYRLAQLGLKPTVRDDVLWRTCQQRDIVLLTANRKQRGKHSLGATIARENTAQHLPVLTLSDAHRVIVDRTFRSDVAAKMIETFLDLDRFRGAGRLWLP